jgi:hypothetical protein
MSRVQRSRIGGHTERLLKAKGKRMGRVPEDPLLRELRVRWASEVVRRCGGSFSKAEKVLFETTPTGQGIIPRPSRFMEQMCKGKNAGVTYRVDLEKLVVELELVPGFRHTRRRYYQPLIRFLIDPPSDQAAIRFALEDCLKKYGLVRWTENEVIGSYSMLQIMRRANSIQTAHEHYYPRDCFDTYESVFLDRRRSVGSRLYFMALLYREAMLTRSVELMGNLSQVANSLLKKRRRLAREFGERLSLVLIKEFRKRVMRGLYYRDHFRDPLPILKDPGVGGFLVRLEWAKELHCAAERYPTFVSERDNIPMEELGDSEELPPFSMFGDPSPKKKRRFRW